MMRKLTLSAAIGGALVLAGCSGGSDDSQANVLTAVGSTVFSSVQAARAGRPEAGGAAIKIVVTRQLLDETPSEVIELVPDNTGVQDFLLLQDSRRDANPGVIETWKSSDNALVITRDGVVISTRGLGGDLRSADVYAAVSGFDGQGGGGERTMVIARSDGIAETVRFSCDMTQLGRETLQIVDQRVSTYRMRENCVYDDVEIVNEYWAETSGGRLRQSRQWVSPFFGYATITRLKN